MESKSYLSHNNFGNLGSEFIIEHKSLRSRNLFIGLIVSVVFAVYADLHMKDIYQLWGLSAILTVVLGVKLYRKVHREVILILPSLGLQVKTEYMLGQHSTRFIDLVHIKDVIINEAITMQAVICYLAVLLKDEESGKLKTLYPLFSHSRHGMEVLTTVYRVTQEKLFPQLKSS